MYFLNIFEGVDDYSYLGRVIDKDIGVMYLVSDGTRILENMTF